MDQARHTVSRAYNRGPEIADLAQWLRAQIDRHNMTQVAAAVHAGVGQATINGISNKGHIPGCEVLFRLTVTWGDRAP